MNFPTRIAKHTYYYITHLADPKSVIIHPISRSKKSDYHVTPSSYPITVYLLSPHQKSQWIRLSCQTIRRAYFPFIVRRNHLKSIHTVFTTVYSRHPISKAYFTLYYLDKYLSVNSIFWHYSLFLSPHKQIILCPLFFGEIIISTLKQSTLQFIYCHLISRSYLPIIVWINHYQSFLPSAESLYIFLFLYTSIVAILYNFYTFENNLTLFGRNIIIIFTYIY